MHQPTFSTGNPIFEYDLRKFGLNDLGHDHRDRRLIIVVTILSAATAIAFYVANRQRSNFFIAGPLFFGVVLNVLTTIIPIVASVYYMFLTISGVSAEVVKGTWEELRLTNVSEDEIFAAKYAIAQLRIHRMLAVTRASQIVGMIFSMVLPWYWPTLVDQMVGNNQGIINPFVGWLLNIGFGLIFAYYVPLWTMKAIVAASMYCAVRFRHSTFAILSGLFMVAAIYLLLRILQTLVAQALSFLLFTTSASVLSLDLLIQVTVYSLISGLLMYSYFRLIRTSALKLGMKAAWQVE